MAESLCVALISDTFHDRDPQRRLTERLREAKSLGAEIAVIPELALNPWAPATKVARDEDAEPLGGPRTQMQAAACREVEIGLVGAVLTNDGGTRLNTAVMFDKTGSVVGTYSKTHLPQEPGFWETSHYSAGTSYGKPFDHLGFPFGVQICSDANRPQGAYLYGAMGALAVLIPRATELATYERWRPVFIASALTSGLYVLSVNRPVPELGVPIGGPSIVVSPRGEVLAETTDPVCVITLDRAVVERARHLYPGYLAVRPELYVKAWAQVSEVAIGDYAE